MGKGAKAVAGAVMLLLLICAGILMVGVGQVLRSEDPTWLLDLWGVRSASAVATLIVVCLTTGLIIRAVVVRARRPRREDYEASGHHTWDAEDADPSESAGHDTRDDE